MLDDKQEDILKNDESNNQVVEKEKACKQKKKILKKWWFWVAISILVLILITGISLFFVYKIPSKYYGTYTQYFYFIGNEYKETYKITPLSIKWTTENTINGEKNIEEMNMEYSKKNKDLIIQVENHEYYLIIDNDCLYVETSKDISTSKKHGTFYWNEKSDKADLYKIENKSEELENQIETTMNKWARKLIYDAYDEELENSNFYMIKSDKETDKTDLNRYKIIYKAAGGELSLYYDRKTQQLNNIYYSGSIHASNYSISSLDSMDIDDIYDSKAMLFSLMYILGNKENIELNQDLEDTNFSKTLPDALYRDKVGDEYTTLFSNKTIDKTDNDSVTYSLDNDKYSVSYTSWISEGVYSFSGIISFSISIK